MLMEQRPPPPPVPVNMNVEKSAEVAQRWMEMVLGEKFVDEFVMVLYNGQKLCALVNKLYKALGMKDKSCTIMETNDYESARANVQAYLRSCVYLGVAEEECFNPDDLLKAQNLGKVYRNILALQIVAVSLSNRRSIDERCSLATSTKFKYDVHAINAIMSPTEARKLSIQVDDHRVAWESLLRDYQQQQWAKEQDDLAKDAQTDGMGRLAHQIWCTEERIRGLLMNDDGGVPDDLHGRLWMLTSGAESDMRRHKGQYQRLVTMESKEDTEAIRQIDADLHRTISDADKMQWNQEKTAMMRRVLVAYSYHNPTLGYCQGLNYIVARLLQFVGEEEAFYLLVKMIKLVPEDYYTTMLGLAVDQHVFADLVRLQTPDIAEHLNELGGSGMELSLACTEWFLTLFASPCEKEVTVRIWDCIFLLGDEVLFRVALALMQRERMILINCNTYGDMLKQLNEIGRDAMDALALTKASKEQDCVIPGRIEDFRAHHRLQLACGIAISSVQGDDAHDLNDRDGHRGHDHQHKAVTPKTRLFGKGKKAGLFKHYDKHAGRLCRTFDRHLTDEYIASLQREHPNFACFYDGKAPTVMEKYWGSAESYSQWGIENVRFVGSPKQSSDFERRRLCSDATLSQSQLRMTSPSTTIASSTGDWAMLQSRERRSKSTAFIPPKKAHSYHHRGRKHQPTDENGHAIGRSPISWIQRLEGWHKDLKLQKERRKAERLKQKLGRKHEQTDYPPLPTRSQRGFGKKKHEQFMYSHSLDGGHSEPMQDTGNVRFTDSDLSAAVHADASTSFDLTEASQFTSVFDAKALAQVTQDIAPSTKPPDTKIDPVSKPPKPRVDTKPPSTSGTTLSTSERPSRSGMSSLHSFSTPSLLSLDRPVDEPLTKSLERAKKPPRHDVVPDPSVASGHLFSPVLSRSHCAATYHHHHDEDEDDAFLRTLVQPRIRRNLSLPLTDTSSSSQDPPSWNQRIVQRRIDNARTIRDRAHVVSYMQRKASDASSMAGSIPRSPSKAETPRLSVSSSNSSHFSDHPRGTMRSSLTGPIRKSSFSFFDKLSIDLEQCLDDLNEEKQRSVPASSLLPSSIGGSTGSVTLSEPL